MTTMTAGTEVDPDGYTVRVDTDSGYTISANGTFQDSDITPGNHLIQLDGVAQNCTAGPENPRSVDVTAGQTTSLAFVVQCTAAAVRISPGQSIQALVDAYPPGTTFVIGHGTHAGQTVVPKSGDRFIGESGAVLDGLEETKYAFTKGNSPYPANVTVRGLKITRYVPDFQSGAIDAGGYAPSEGTTGWIIDSNEVAYNAEYGIRIGNSTRIANNNVHHNGRLNIGGGGHNTTVDSNEIAFGNYLNTSDADFEAGGVKFTYTDSLRLSNNYVHDNVGPGLWMDLNNINTTIDGNRIDHNGSEGIIVEISYKTSIFNNTVTNNGWFDPRNRYTWLWNAGIGVHASPDVEIYGNTVSGNYAGIVAIEQNRRRDPAEFGPHVVQNLDVRDNTITQTNLPRTQSELSVAAGIVTDIAGNTSIFTGRNNRFSNNTYNLGQNILPFAWMNHTAAGE